MERLTTPGGECISMGEPCCPDENCAEACLLMHLELANEHLAAYEGTGLSPDEIKQLAADRRISLADKATAEYLAYLALGTIDDLTALTKAREGGRVVVLPCKVGTPIWYIDVSIEPSERGRSKWTTRKRVKATKFDYSVLDWIDTPIYLSSAEAEAALGGVTRG